MSSHMVSSYRTSVCIDTYKLKTFTRKPATETWVNRQTRQVCDFFLLFFRFEFRVNGFAAHPEKWRLGFHAYLILIPHDCIIQAMCEKQREKEIGNVPTKMCLHFFIIVIIFLLSNSNLCSCYRVHRIVCHGRDDHYCYEIYLDERGCMFLFYYHTPQAHPPFCLLSCLTLTAIKLS